MNKISYILFSAIIFFVSCSKKTTSEDIISPQVQTMVIKEVDSAGIRTLIYPDGKKKIIKKPESSKGKVTTNSTQIGYDLDELSDVDLDGPSFGNFQMKYETEYVVDLNTLEIIQVNHAYTYLLNPVSFRSDGASRTSAVIGHTWSLLTPLPAYAFSVYRTFYINCYYQYPGGTPRTRQYSYSKVTYHP
ncbi:hypothetical protein [Pseudobacter ginsenosidimutans]|uniref:Uncharacterized protein n=1 Tax=Pseudobacter ginsenosidimutans TaxID=661488 RepID=A0A4Q7MS76_9BACT|nr:hypothetical protein [Pseudobacter ginsenosidimutans]QEC41569.1 hypothetical protein FSB84_07605 [Pseudobacter ginsenosidimutans]RZS71646.1 hypothetical protein EV199_3553 [Pseudobacter ginsenosidimutans]